jgi:hypothetical protein
MEAKWRCRPNRNDMVAPLKCRPALTKKNQTIGKNGLDTLTAGG